MSRRALLIADATWGVGLGHLARSTGLAQALVCEHIEVVCIALGATAPIERGEVLWVPAPNLAAIEVEPSSRDIVVLDSYLVGIDEARRRTGDAALVAFWDRGEPPEADLVISLGSAIPDGMRGLSGVKYACLGRDYWQPPACLTRAKVERILVAAGGADPTGAATTLCEAALRAAPDAEVVLVMGPQTSNGPPPGVTVLRAPPSLREALLEADLVVTAAGQTMLEALASGTPCIALPVVSNQRPQIRSLVGTGGVRIVEPGDPKALREAIAGLAYDPAARRALSTCGMDAIDGHGALRVAKELSRLR